jgi:hypothetical protein
MEDLRDDIEEKEPNYERLLSGSYNVVVVLPVGADTDYNIVTC